MKKYRKTLILTSALTLSPMLIGLLLWNRLPALIPTHFGTDNVADGWSSKPFAVFGLPLLLLVIHFICSLAILNDPKQKNVNMRFFQLFFWIVPVISLICCLSCYAAALGINVDIGMMICLAVGVIFIVIGGFMQKIKQNYTVGIKLPWTLHSEENWNQTHKLASWVWMAGGLVFVICSFLHLDSLIVAVIAVMAVVPIAYSFILYKRGI